MPNASFIGFTCTPIEKTDANTRAVFGDYISIYDIQRAVADKATVPIVCMSRRIAVDLRSISSGGWKTAIAANFVRHLLRPPRQN